MNWKKRAFSCDWDLCDDITCDIQDDLLSKSVLKILYHCRTNCCIGLHNHLAFLGAIFLFIVTGLWGVYLSFFTICKSLNGKILHLDCSDVYSDSR